MRPVAAKKLGLEVTGKTGKMKAVNSKAVPTQGIVSQAEIQMGPWDGKITFTAVEMDDFDVVLGMKFIRKHRAIPIPTHTVG